ncbi:MAG TPA: TIGR03013 family XrtA/PEP-CTERM system glycosyltransferase [Vicinamibacterales bacterium]|nr:TIGR03013 family XrtA/PEP-CTERM system glycosyltransferase [Vicinamibacterales bacterium]
MQLFDRYVSPRSLTVFAAELFLIFGSVSVAAGIQDGLAPGAATLWKIAVVTLLCQLCLYYNDFYDLTVVHTSRELVVRLFQAVGAASILLAALYFVAPGLTLGTSTFIPALVVFLVAILGWRLLFNRVATMRGLEERVLIVGTGQSARTVARQILAQRDFGYRVVGFIDEDPSRVGERVVNPGIVGTPLDIPRLVARERIDRIVVGLSDRRGKLPVDELLRAKLAGVRVEDVTSIYERLTGKILVEDVRPSWLIFGEGFRVSRWTRLVKRTLDLTMALVMTVIGAPFMLLTALAVYLEDGAPVLYSQERVGEHGRVFRVHKFRSMRKDAESAGRPIWAQADDDRVTRVGRIIRKTRLDELPQLWNVLRGDMSFVGPRPERPFFVEQLAAQIPFYEQRHAVKPGLTGWAQVKYRYGASLEDAIEKLRYDLYYIKHVSPAFDLTIIFDTVKVILFRKGAQ